MASTRMAILVPELPESVADATVVALHHQPGDAVRRDELLVELETDKVVLEVPAPTDGVLVGYQVTTGAVVQAGALLGHLEFGATAASTPIAAPATPAPAPALPDAAPATPAPAPAPAPPPPPSPGVRRLLAEHALSPEDLRGTGEQGRLRKEDVTGFLASRSSAASAPPEAAPAPAVPKSPVAAHPQHPTTRSPLTTGAPTAPATPSGTPSGTVSSPTPRSDRHEERVPMSRLRARIAERLLQAKQETAMLTTFNEVDMSAIHVLRSRHQEAFQARHGVRLGFMGFFVQACTAGLVKHPVIHARIDGAEIVYPAYADIGIAVSTPRGLVVPVLRDAGQLTLADIEKKIRDMGERARDGRLGLEELRGGTFTITNGGVFGSLLSTPILNPPQSAILGMHTIQDRPVARDGAVVIRPMMYLALSYDHRIIDGADAVRFLVHVKQTLEDPARLLLDL
jgi:2-oxoglutarate dehydrogenase E2 component (dihydrolipoamide succinyltransferase)